MNGHSENLCADDRMIVAYSHGDLSAAQMLTFEEHLLGCEACRAQVSELRGTRSLLGEIALVRRMQIASHGLAPAGQTSPAASPSSDLLTALERGLEAAARRAEDSRDEARVSSLREWGRRLAANARQAVEKLSGGAADTQPSQTPSLEVLREIGWAWLQRIEPLVALPTGGPVRGSRSGSPRRAAPAPVVSGPPGVVLRLEPIAGSQDMELIAKGLPTGAEALLALLIPKSAPDQTQAAVLRRVTPTHDEWTARFKNVPPGEYALAIEPLSNRPAP